jgi:DNA-binding transcriptional LysR family regulator
MLAWHAFVGNHLNPGDGVPTFRQIEAFQAVMTAGSVTKAADVLGLGQPAVSRLIADLETSIGLPLFLRAARTLTPTLKARELAREVERSFLGMHHIRATAHRLAANDHGAVRLAVVPSLVAEVTHALIGPFARAHPDIAMTVEVLATLEAAELLETVCCDLGITNEHIQATDLHAQVISRHVAVCAVPRRHRLARRGRPLQPKDLAGERFVSFMPTSRFRHQLDKVFADAKVERDLRYEVRTTAAACEMVLALDAATIVPVAPRVEPSSHLRLLPFRPALTSDVVLLKHRHRALTPTAELFATFVREHGGSIEGARRPRGQAPSRASKPAGSPLRFPARRRQPSQGARNCTP